MKKETRIIVLWFAVAVAGFIWFIGMGGVFSIAYGEGAKIPNIVTYSTIALISGFVMLGTGYFLAKEYHVPPPLKLSDLRSSTVYEIYDVKVWYDQTVEMYVSLHGAADNKLLAVRVEADVRVTYINSKKVEKDKPDPKWLVPGKLFQLINEMHGHRIVLL